MTSPEKSKKRCFVISPIGADDSDVREHADAVFDFIIKPAMEECGIQAIRSDHVDKLGKISEQMFHSILTDDLCIAVLTFHNPNVFYELAIAQAASRPVLILIEKGQQIPFDLHDLRTITYDLKPRPLFDKIYVKQIVAKVRDLEAANWHAPCPIPGLAARMSGACNVLTLAQYRDYEPKYGWLPLVEETQHHFDLMGTSLTTFRRNKGIKDLMLGKAAAGCKIRILMFHPKNQAFGLIRNRDLPEEQLDHTVSRVEEGLAFYRSLASATPNIEVRQMNVGCPHYQLTRTDSKLVFVPYLYSETTSYCPLLRLERDSPLFEKFLGDFDALWAANAPAS